MPYKSGEQPKKGDTVLGDKLKGVVAIVVGKDADNVQVRVRAPFNRRRPNPEQTVLVEKKAEELTLVLRGPDAP